LGRSRNKVVGGEPVAGEIVFKLQTEIISFLIFSSFVLFISGILVSLAYIFNTPQRNLAKLSAYECGFQKISAISIPFDVQFYRVAIIFLIFDVEVAFLFP
jgi:NADH:ubiquinone oxidoreductase subunit 3 (subunit A)